MYKVDLNELSKRESERVEWKENVADIDNVIKTCVAFANDFSNLGGGYIVCGAKESQDEHGFQKLIETGLTSSKLKEIENKVLSDLREKVFPSIVPLTEELPVSDERRILVFIVPATGDVHSFRAGGKDTSTYYVRIGRETREAKNGILRELLVKKNRIESWDKRVNHHSSIDDIDLLALREYLKEMSLWDNNKALEDYISDKERLSTFVPPLAGRESLEKSIKPRNFTLLLFAKDPSIFLPTAFMIVSIYKGKDRGEPTAERHEIVGSIVEQARKALMILNAEAYTTFDKNDHIPNQIKYPIRALQEAVINSLVHRDYEIDQPARITVFIDRIEIYSPGSLPRAIDKDKFVEGKATPFWRNQALAYFFNKLQLAQAEGQGIPTIIRTMKEEGCPDPIFELGADSVTCILPAHPRHALIKTIQEIENDIILGKIDDAYKKTSEILKGDPYNFRAIDLLCEISNIQNNPELLIAFLSSSDISFSKLNPSTLINIAETISLIRDNEWVPGIIDAISRRATSVLLEEREIEKAVIAMKRFHRDEELISYVNEIFKNRPALATNILMLQNKARASMDMAKKCIDTAKKDGKVSPYMRRKAWDQARVYIEEAGRDLDIAMVNASSIVEKDYLRRDIEFLEKMRGIARRPNRR